MMLAREQVVLLAVSVTEPALMLIGPLPRYRIPVPQDTTREFGEEVNQGDWNPLPRICVRICAPLGSCTWEPTCCAGASAGCMRSANAKNNRVDSLMFSSPP